MSIIKTVLTALMDDEVNKELKNQEGIEVLCDDLLYQEAVLEKIKEKEKVDFLLLNENLPGEKLEDFIKKINNIKIVLFVDKSTKIAKNLIDKKVYSIFTNGEKTVEELVKIIKEDNYIQKLEKEIENLRKVIEEKENKKINLPKIIEKIKEKEPKIKNHKIITIAGTSSKEKEIFSTNLMKELNKKQIKAKLVDFDVFNYQSSSSFFEIKNNRIKGTDIIFKNKEQVKVEELQRKLEKIKKKNEILIINTPAECFFDYTKLIMNESEKIFLITENNVSEIKKSEKFLEIYTKNWKINEEKIDIIICQIQKENKKYINKNLYISKIIKIISMKNKIREDEEIYKVKYRKKDYINIINKISQ